jgi:hypothetical protein
MKRFVVLLFFVVAGLSALWAIGKGETWGPNLEAADPAYRSGRASLCKAPALAGETWPSRIEERKPQPLDRGAERALIQTFEAARFVGGAIDVCSEYGFVNIAGINGTQGRVEVTVSNPFPGGARAIDDTRVTTELRVIDGRLQIRVVQLTQGLTAFKSFFSKGNRLATVNVVVQVPRSGTYALRLTANHQRITIQDIDIHGVLEGYASPGANIDAGLDGPLAVRLSGVSYQSRWAGASNLDGGTMASLRPMRSSSVELKADDGDVRLEVVGTGIGLDVATSGSASDIRIGPTEVSHIELSTAAARSAGFSQAEVQLRVRASTGKGSVAVTRSQR